MRKFRYTCEVEERTASPGVHGARKTTLPETNSKFAPEHWWLKDEFPFGGVKRPIFQGLSLLVSGKTT